MIIKKKTFLSLKVAHILVEGQEHQQWQCNVVDATKGITKFSMLQRHEAPHASKQREHFSYSLKEE